MGNPIVLKNGAELSFVLTNSQVTGGYCGNAYAINCFDDTNFANINNLMSSWAVLKKHQAVFFCSN
ncbi:hypothetical protein HWQ46_25805 [Shewanella sp. D64]|uniref:hypothetical protein n=1 Tax=unclassified Shewanella TaxID=196818 RepID=UPI0022BA4B07|nr:MULTISPECIES: hypothetical protein [unclassified Shewanella]MEC4728933.1 hypothetical protein [Shewanella sp. D64]MEC4740866.1 hypothetical protein [Shewanella sp. E94]WBJ96707.1 hypothetical protein HWQ47_06220 [Shewanella sp. MTB7]